MLSVLEKASTVELVTAESTDVPLLYTYLQSYEPVP